MKDEDSAIDPVEEIILVPSNTEQLLNDRQYLDYRTEREHCLEWLLSLGKEPDRGEGYAKATVSNRAYRMDKFYRWVWEPDGLHREMPACM